MIAMHVDALATGTPTHVRTDATAYRQADADCWSRVCLSRTAIVGSIGEYLYYCLYYLFTSTTVQLKNS